MRCYFSYFPHTVELILLYKKFELSLCHESFFLRHWFFSENKGKKNSKHGSPLHPAGGGGRGGRGSGGGGSTNPLRQARKPEEFLRSVPSFARRSRHLAPVQILIQNDIYLLKQFVPRRDHLTYPKETGLK